MADSLDYGLLSPRVTLNELLEKEAESLTPAARYERSTSWTRKFFRPALIISRDAMKLPKFYHRHLAKRRQPTTAWYASAPMAAGSGASSSVTGETVDDTMKALFRRAGLYSASK